MVSAKAVCCIYLLTLLINVSTQANSVDPDQTAPVGAVWSGSTLFDQEASKIFQQMAKAAEFCCY